MASPLYNQLGESSRINPLFNRIKQFRQTFSGDPRQMVQNMLNSGKITQAQVNQYAQQANEIYKTLGGKF